MENSNPIIDFMKIAIEEEKRFIMDAIGMMQVL
ncbi:hypothetical protein MetfoDRAFT_0309 [Methanotorris formicicus Mc-S-70]|uniref:Uncharacterized protein n=1 Tax=Methanotorris formicicus Mc-S-70 TaxID=647171 RepID=H1KWY6_9EURY|nr:hypothetical protein MetfoDRAFT_0309 [Methanotorris formicicus Mc-S-70]